MTYERIYGAKVVNTNLLADSENVDTPSESVLSSTNAPANEDDNHKSMVIDDDQSELLYTNFHQQQAKKFVLKIEEKYLS